MLSRRHLRIRVMQALYSWFQSEQPDLNRSLESIFYGAERTYDLYLSLIQLFTEIAFEEDRYYADLQPGFIRKHTITQSRFSNNLMVTLLSGDDAFKQLLRQRKISWQNHTDLLHKLFYLLRQTDEYKKYVALENHTPEEDLEFIRFIYKEVIMPSEVFQTTIDEQNIWWSEAMEFINSMVLKTIKQTSKSETNGIELMPLYRDKEDDRLFMETLFKETIRNDAWFGEMIRARTRNWELERIALMDIILLKMTLAEILSFPAIPVKVSINEYIDISKEYSTPKSKLFINGVIDKIVADLRDEGKIIKTGRGLIE